MTLDPVVPIIIGSVVSVSALVLTVVTFIVSGKREERKRRLEYKKEQLSKFYAPLWGQRVEILSLTLFGNVVGAATVASLSKLTAGITDETTEDSQRLRKMADQENMRDIQYTNKQLIEQRLPAYQRMQDIFRDNIHLADPESLRFFPLLIGFNDTWKRSNEDGWSNNLMLAKEVGITESRVHPLYEHLDAKVRQLRCEIAGEQLKDAPPLDQTELVKELQPPSRLPLR